MRRSASTSRRDPGDDVISVDAKCPIVAPRNSRCNPNSDIRLTEALASVNLMSLFGLHRELRGATIGHFASTEITSSPGSRRLVDALRRMDAPEACVTFYAEH